MFLHMKIRWILVAALFLLFAGLFAWEKGWLPFDQLQAGIPVAGGQAGRHHRAAARRAAPAGQPARTAAPDRRSPPAGAANPAGQSAAPDPDRSRPVHPG